MTVNGSKIYTSQVNELVRSVWLLPMVPPINDLIVNMSKGSISQSPIKTNNGWHVIKLDDVRLFVMPQFEWVKNTITQELAQ